MTEDSEKPKKKKLTPVELAMRFHKNFREILEKAKKPKARRIKVFEDISK